VLSLAFGVWPSAWISTPQHHTRGSYMAVPLQVCEGAPGVHQERHDTGVEVGFASSYQCGLWKI
jgi:hypothetical protein